MLRTTNSEDSMRVHTIILGLAVALALGPWGSAGGGSAGSEFFNGKDLTGWEGLPDFWSVKEGAIVGSCGPKALKFNTFLCSKKKYGDFELQCQIRLKDGAGNSGIQIRSEIFDKAGFRVKGPQADVGANYWGSLYGENFGGMMKEAPREQVNKVLKKDGFNDYYVKCVGKHVTIRVNGVTTVDQEFAKMPAEGIIALQLHAPGPMEVTFRNIRFTDLSKK
jgi:hypothetical protein